MEAGGQDCDRAADAGDRDPVADTGRGGYDPVAELEAGFAPNEVALALTLTQGGAEYWMDLAVSLTRRLPATLAALAEGTIDLNRARLIDQYTSSLDAGLAQTVERRVLVRAEHQTTGQLRASLQRAVLAADPAAAERRRQEAQRRAWVALFGDHDGTASLSGRFLPAAQAAAAWARICAMAKAMEAAGAGGGMDLLRAQVFVGLLLGTLPLIPPSDGGPADAGPDDGGRRRTVTARRVAGRTTVGWRMTAGRRPTAQALTARRTTAWTTAGRTVAARAAIGRAAVIQPGVHVTAD